MSRLDLTLIVGALVTVSATEIDCGLLGAPVELIATFPEYVPAPIPAGLTETLRFAGVLPLFGVTASQLPPEVVVAVAVKIKAPVEVTLRVCVAGLLWPAVAVNAILEGDKERLAATPMPDSLATKASRVPPWNVAWYADWVGKFVEVVNPET